MLQHNDEVRRGELEDLRREVERERFERRDALNKIRYEFEEFVHKKIDKILLEVERFKDVEDDDDNMQQAEIDNIASDTGRLKEGLVRVQESWTDLCQTSLRRSDTH